MTISSCFTKAASASKNTVAKYVLPAVSNYAFRHPHLNATTLAVAVPAIGGMAVAAPLLGLVGFGAAGPVGGKLLLTIDKLCSSNNLAGSATAAYQSAYGATTMFSVLQSAAMGGFGSQLSVVECKVLV